MSAGEMAANMAVLELPPRFSLSSHVSTESRYGMNSAFFFLSAALASRDLFRLLFTSAKAEMTLPRVVSDLLMLAPSFRRVPCAPVDMARSLPVGSLCVFDN